jgi:hypothetical protein
LGRRGVDRKIFKTLVNHEEKNTGLWIGLYRVQWRAFLNYCGGAPGTLRGGKFLYHLNDLYFLNKVSVA